MDSSEWDSRYAERELLWTAEPNQFVAAEVAGEDPGAALDVACGEGRNAVWLAEQGWRVTAVDFSAVALDKARALAAGRNVTVDWVLADVVEYRPRPASFDLVVVAYLHVPPPERAAVLGAAAAALAPGGLALVIGHDLENLEHGIGGPQDPDILLTPTAVVADLKGLKIEKAEKALREVDKDGVVGIAIDTLVRARRPPGA